MQSKHFGSDYKQTHDVFKKPTPKLKTIWEFEARFLATMLLFLGAMLNNQSTEKGPLGRKINIALDSGFYVLQIFNSFKDLTITNGNFKTLILSLSS